MRWHEAARFLIAGGFNTALGYALYLLFNLYVDYRAAYSISFACGVLVSYLLNSLYVFRVGLAWKRLALYPAVYVVQYLAGVLTIWLLVARLRVAEAYAPLAAIVVTLPLTFLVSRYLLTGGHRVDDR
jgi:putative flippase GtrA